MRAKAVQQLTAPAGPMQWAVRLEALYAARAELPPSQNHFSVSSTVQNTGIALVVLWLHVCLTDVLQSSPMQKHFWCFLKQCGLQAERRCSQLEEEVQALQGQLQAQDADLAELHLKCQSAERRAAESASAPSSAQEKGTATAADTASKARAEQSSTRNMLLAQVPARLHKV